MELTSQPRYHNIRSNSHVLARSQDLVTFELLNGKSMTEAHEASSRNNLSHSGGKVIKRVKRVRSLKNRNAQRAIAKYKTSESHEAS